MKRSILGALVSSALLAGCGSQAGAVVSGIDAGASDAARAPDVSSDRGIEAGSAAEADAATPAAGLRAVWSSSSSDVWAVGAGGVILHFDGQSWTPVASGTTENLTGVSGTAPDDVWATGDNGSVLHWTGQAWSIAQTNDGVALLAIWATTSTDVWAVGVDFGGGNGGGSGFVVHWDGTEWQFSDVDDSTSLWAIWASGGDDVWMVGDDMQGDGVIVRGAGTSANPFDQAAFTGPELRAIWGVSPQDVWLSPYQGVLEHWDGSSFTPSASLPAGQEFFSVSGTATNDVWAVGLNGVAYHYDGNAWTASPTGTTNLLSSVSADAPGDAWAVGASGTILQWNGTAWVP